MHTATLYTRTGCHLCDEALAVLNRHGVRPEVVDIDRDSDLVARYGDCVPVVLIDGRLRFRGRVDERLLRRLLRPPSWRDRVINLFRRARLR
jgi:glutaredoxin